MRYTNFMEEEKNTFLYKCLRIPLVYKSYQNLITKSNTYENIYKNIFKSDNDSLVLDCGCGPAHYRKYLNCEKYYGIDFNKKHIKKAQQRYPNDEFINGNVISYDFSQLPKFSDIIIFGLLHHLNDQNSINLINKLLTQVQDSGKIVAIDPVYVFEESSFYNKIANYIASKDQGNFVRDESGYKDLVEYTNGRLEQKVVKNLLRIPFNHNVISIYNV